MLSCKKTSLGLFVSMRIQRCLPKNFIGAAKKYLPFLIEFGLYHTQILCQKIFLDFMT